MFDQVVKFETFKKKSESLHGVSRDLLDIIVLSHVLFGSEVGEGTYWRTELSQVGQRGAKCRDAQGWGLDVRAPVLD